jgi:hypothetical protein
MIDLTRHAAQRSANRQSRPLGPSSARAHAASWQSSHGCASRPDHAARFILVSLGRRVTATRRPGSSAHEHTISKLKTRGACCSETASTERAFRARLVRHAISMNFYHGPDRMPDDGEMGVAKKSKWPTRTDEHPAMTASRRRCSHPTASAFDRSPVRQAAWAHVAKTFI